jgi:hypothetical protein
VVLTALAPVYPRHKGAAEAHGVAPQAAGASPAPNGADGFPDGLTGIWNGTVTQTSPATQSGPAAGPSTTFTVTLVLRGGTVGNVVGTSRYPTIPCSGELVLLGSGGSDVQVTEHILTGTDGCVDTTLSLRLDGAGRLIYHFDDVGYGKGDAVLTRQ